MFCSCVGISNRKEYFRVQWASSFFPTWSEGLKLVNPCVFGFKNTQFLPNDNVLEYFVNKEDPLSGALSIMWLKKFIRIALMREGGTGWGVQMPDE